MLSNEGSLAESRGTPSAAKARRPPGEEPHASMRPRYCEAAPALKPSVAGDIAAAPAPASESIASGNGLESLPVAYSVDVERSARFWELLGFRRHYRDLPEVSPGTSGCAVIPRRSSRSQLFSGHLTGTASGWEMALGSRCTSMLPTPMRRSAAPRGGPGLTAAACSRLSCSCNRDYEPSDRPCRGRRLCRSRPVAGGVAISAIDTPLASLSSRRGPRATGDSAPLGEDKTRPGVSERLDSHNAQPRD